jgi:putative flippase GtrA
MQSFLSPSKILPAGSRRRKETKRFLKFAIVGALGALIDFAILNVLVLLAGFLPVVANGISFSAAVAQNFLLNRWWTFPESQLHNTRRQMAKFTLVSVAGLGINTIVFQFVDLSMRAYWIEWLSDPDLGATISYNFAKLFSIGVVLFWNFSANRLWTYKGL